MAFSDVKVLVSLFLLVIFSCTEGGNKYSQGVNVGPDDRSKMDSPFRANKVNQVWEKARKRLPEAKLLKLYDELKIQDTNEMNLKKMKLENKDADGEKEADVRKRLHDIMINYRLIDGKNVYNDEMNSVEHAYKRDVFLDGRLRKLWKAAEKSGFSDAELEDLRREFDHHQMKIDEYEQLLSDEDNPDEMANSLEHLKIENAKKTKPKKDIHSMKKEIKTGYEKLAKKATKAGGEVEFEEPKVYDLWAQAVKANFTEKELVSFKEELKHFERKIQKHRYMKEHVEISAKQVNHPGKVKEGSPDNLKKLEHKATDYAFKVKKLEHELVTKVKKALARHSEL